MIDTNGMPAILGNQPLSGPFSTEAGKNELLQLSGPSQVSVSTLVSTMLAMNDAEVFIGVDGAARKVFCAPTTPSAVYDEVTAECALVPNLRIGVIKPKANQVGKALEWEWHATPVGFHADTKTAIDAILAPVAPTYTAGAISQRILADLPEGKSCTLLINQTTGQIAIYQDTSGAFPQNANELITLVEAGGIVVGLTEPAGQEEPNALKFEGGLV